MKTNPTHTPLPQKKWKKPNLDIPDYSTEWNPGTASTTQISLLQSHHKHALLLNKNNNNNNCFETTKQKLI